MTLELFTDNLLSWIAQVFIVASLGALLPMVFRISHPRTHLLYCQLVLLACLMLPLIQTWQYPVVEISAQPAPEVVTPPANAAPEDPIAPGIPWGRILVWTIAAGAVGRLGWLGSGLWRIRKYRLTTVPLHPRPRVLEAAQAMTGASAMFCVSASAVGPVTFGFFRPVILLPDSFLTMTEEAQCAIACHELLHVRRRDWLVTAIEEIAGAILWFHPVIWWMLAQTRLSREQLVDAEVVRLTASPDRYIDALLAVAGAGPAMELIPAPLFLRRRHLTQRIHFLLTEVSVSKTRLLSSYLSIVIVLGLAGRTAFALFPMIGEAQTRGGAVVQAPQTTNQDSGFVVNRRPLSYPAEARQKRIEGTVVVEVTFNVNREIVDTRIISGPEELRRAALQTALQSTYGPDVSRVIQVVVDFRLNPAPVPPPPPSPPPPPGASLSQDVISSIEILGLEEPSLTQLRGQLQTFQGRVTTPEVMAAIRQTAESFRQTGLGIGIGRNSNASGSTTLRIVFSEPSTSTVTVGPQTDPQAPPGIVRIRVGGTVLQANLRQRVDPVYPDLARQSRIQGIVVLEATIDTEGRVTNLRAISGHPLFIQAAIDAVRQWVYSPILLNGEPREVVSTVTVNFSLQE